MGGIVSIHTKNHLYEDDVPIDIACYIEEYTLLGLKYTHIIQFYTLFHQICLENQCVSSIPIHDLLIHYFLVEYNSFTSLIFTSFDVDIYTNTDIDFARFIQAIWNYCTLDETGICACVFNLYDRLDEGYIHKKDVCRMIQELYGSDYKICEEARITQKEIEENRRRHIDYENFEKLAGAYPALLYPAFVYQHVLRSKVLGERFWKPLETVRAHLMPSKHIKYVPVRVLLMSRTDRQAIRRYVENREQISAMKIATLRSMNSMKLPRDRRGSQSDVESSTNAPSSPSTQSRRRHSNVGKHMDMHGTFLSSMYRDIKRSLSGAELNQPFNLQPSRFRFSGDKAISESRERCYS